MLPVCICIFSAFLIVPSIFSNVYYLKYNSPFYNISEVTGKCYRIRVHVNFDDITELGLACWYSTNKAVTTIEASEAIASLKNPSLFLK
jgi:hypothetical protein